MNTYTYIDKSKYPAVKQAFNCQAESLPQADEKYKAETGNDPGKQPYIHCQIEFGKAVDA